MKSSFLPIAVGVLVTSLAVGFVVGQHRGSVDDPPPVASKPAVSGAILYQTGCANCHGPDGRGDGPSAATLRPAPRDFAARPWRFDRTRDSARKVIADGIPGTAMPAGRASYSPAEIEALAEHVLALGNSRPPVTFEPPRDEQLAIAAGFSPAGGTPPALEVTDPAGKAVRLTDLQGKLVLVNFWATDCAHCLKKFPSLQALERRFSDRGLVVLPVCTDADAKEASDAAAKVAPGIRVYSDLRGTASAAFEVQSLPTVWLIGPAGEVVAKTTGAKDWESPTIAALLEYWLPNK